MRSFATSGAMWAPSLIFIASLGGCAGVPPMSRSYYFPRAQTKLVVTQTIGCSSDNRRLVSVVNATPTVTYLADHSPGTPPGSISYKASGGFLKNPDLGITSLPDGRLSGINATSSGQGGTVLKDLAAIGVGVATGGVGGAALAAGATAANEAGGAAGQTKPPVPKSQIQSDCEAIQKFAATPSTSDDNSGGDARGGGHAGAGAGPKPTNTLTLTYSVALIYSTSGVHYTEGKGYVGGAIQVDPSNNPQGYDTTPTNLVVLRPDPDSLAAYNAVKLIQGTVMVRAGPWQAVDNHSGWDGHPDWHDDASQKAPAGFQAIKLNRVAEVPVRVGGPVSFADAKADDRGKKQEPAVVATAWSGVVEVPLQIYYPLLIPKGMPFGSQNFALSLSEAYAITKLEYGSHSAGVDALNTATSLAKGMPTAETYATEMSAHNDLVYQQQRTIICTTNPSACPVK